METQVPATQFFVSRSSYGGSVLKAATDKEDKSYLYQKVDLTDNEIAFINGISTKEFWLRLMTKAAQHGYDFLGSVATMPKLTSDYRRFTERNPTAIPILLKCVVAGKLLHR